ncbi:MAG TPA: EAL domain-containing protein [Beijerinckiaceae bacterium]|nr:EAL domain-containing protein [Beijerinckiaceae bacterium]
MARPRLLIVDDIADNRAVLARRFERRGFEIAEADGGNRALELVAQQSFDLVLLDVMMPDIDGMEVLRRLREQHSPVSLPIIMVTAKSQSEDVVKALELGANDYVTKPVDFAVALARANTQIGRKRAEEEVRLANDALRMMNEQLEQRVAERTESLASANDRLRLEIEHRRQSEEKVHYLAHHDALTGLGNRVLLRQQLEEALVRTRRNGGAVAMICLDLDGFKGVNDALGHSVGDALLKSVAARLQENVRDTDKVARLGGDEFAVLQSGDSQPRSADALSGRLVAVMSEPFFIEGHQINISLSAGIAVSSGNDVDPEELLKNADLALYRAKADGRGTYRFFEPEMDALAQARRSMEVELRGALTRREFELHYQPLINLRTRKIAGFEALLRWSNATRGFISPGQFIPLAEELGLIAPIGEWAIRQACEHAAGWPGDTKVAVNLSPVQFRSTSLVPAVVQALSASGLAPGRLELEITESVLLDDSDRNLAILRQIRELGVRIAMDDFGTGYSSLSYLRRFHFEKVKIDRSFISDVAKNAESRAIVRAITGMCSNLGMATTAEGVETAEQLGCVTSEGCTEAQGYYFSPAKPVAEVGALLAKFGRV